MNKNQIQNLKSLKFTDYQIDNMKFDEFQINKNIKQFDMNE